MGSELTDDIHLDDDSGSSGKVNNNHSWREHHGGCTPMAEFGSGFIQFAARGPGGRNAFINLSVPVASRDDEPICLHSAARDGYEPFFLSWRKSDPMDLGHLNGWLLRCALSGGSVTICWRPDLENPDVEMSFTIPIRISRKW
jgi:hypothetical protein